MCGYTSCGSGGVDGVCGNSPSPSDPTVGGHVAGSREVGRFRRQFVQVSAQR